MGQGWAMQPGDERYSSDNTRSAREILTLDGLINHQAPPIGRENNNKRKVTSAATVSDNRKVTSAATDSNNRTVTSPTDGNKRKVTLDTDSHTRHNKSIDPVPLNNRRSERIAEANAQAAKSIYNFSTNTKFKHLDPAKIVIPRNHGQAKRSPEWEYWHEAEDLEVKGIEKAGCFVVEDLPKGATIVDGKWVYDLKTESLNEIVRFKARLSARGDQLIYDDLTGIFSPVVSWVGIRYFLALTVLLKLKPL